MKTTGQPHASRRQWGADRRTGPVSAGPGRSTERRLAAGRLAVMVTVIAWLTYFGTWLNGEFIDGGADTARTRVEAFVYLVIVTFLTGSALAYLVSRLGFLYRSREYRPVPRAELDDFFGQAMPTLTVIVPSYREDERVIRNTLLSAALQEYPYLRAVLLIDDPPVPRTKGQRRLLQAARHLPAKIEAMLDRPSRDFGEALARFECRSSAVGPDDVTDAAAAYDRAVAYLEELAGGIEIVDHSDRFFVDHVVLALATDLATVASALRAALADGVVPPRDRLHQLYRRLAWTFHVQMTSFERKRYASLSAEANKAMNLNSYIGLMGGSYRDIATPSGRVLVPCTLGHGDLSVPDPDYVLTLDADSILLPEYCVRLVHLMEQTQFSDVAVAQSPYTAYPGAASRLERIAGATTDIQHIVHQGMTHYDATFWVGANAVLRKRALDDICERTYVGDFEIRRYVQDRTVIEDTESTIDLGRHGWKLFNYPARLAYSATPPDFGSLCIQRRRWANGGLLILGKYWRQVRQRRRKGERVRLGEIFLRTNYMGSICWSSISLLFLLAYPFHNDLVSPLLGLIALPYFVAMASDLKASGYKRSDVFRIYGFNLILVAVNLAGVGASLVQAITADKSTFGRTPKVRNRTVPNLLFVVAPYLVLVLATYTLYSDFRGHRYVNFGYAVLNSVLVAYAIVAFIGVRNSVADMLVQTRARLYKPTKPLRAGPVVPAAVLAAQAGADWNSVLQLDHVSMPRKPLASGPALVRSSRPTLADPSPQLVLPLGTEGRLFVPEEFDPGVAFRTVFQPIVSLSTETVLGFEALSRFEDGVGPDRWLRQAAARGSGIELETALARAALRAARNLPDDAWLALNATDAFVAERTRLLRLAEEAAQAIVLEVGAGEQLRHAVARLLADLPRGLSVSVTGTEPSYESLKLVDEFRPSFAKLDRRWIDGIAGDRARAALVRSFVALAAEANCTVIAEGIETPEDLAVLRDLGVDCGQGYLIGRPRDMADTWSQLPEADRSPVR